MRNEENDEARMRKMTKHERPLAILIESLVLMSKRATILDMLHQFEAPAFLRHSSFGFRHLSEVNPNPTSIFARHDKIRNASHSDLWSIFRSDTMEICIVRPGTVRPILNSRRTRPQTTKG